jgi:hypothetical protein
VNHPNLMDPLLTVKWRALQVHNAALVVHYTDSPFHLESLEAEIERLDRDLAGLRMALQAIRSRGEEPTKHGAAS